MNHGDQEPVPVGNTAVPFGQTASAIAPGFPVTGQDFAFDPDDAADEVLALPDRSLRLHAVDHEAASVHRRGAMGRGNRDRDRRLPDVHAAKAMHDRDAPDPEASLGLRRDLLHHALGHPAVGFVLEEDDARARR